MRAGVFIDGAYLVKAAKAAGVDLDFEQLALYLLEPLYRRAQVDLMRVYFYDCAPYKSANATEDEIRRAEVHQKFYDYIEDIDRWEFRLGKLERRQAGDRAVYEQKRVDVKLSVDLVHHASAGHIQYAIIVAGDSDFIPAVTSAKYSGVTVLVWGANRKSLHRDLDTAADMVEIIDWAKIPTKKNAPTAQKNAPTAQKSAPTAQKSAPTAQKSAPTAQNAEPTASVKDEPSGEAPAKKKKKSTSRRGTKKKAPKKAEI